MLFQKSQSVARGRGRVRHVYQDERKSGRQGRFRETSQDGQEVLPLISQPTARGATLADWNHKGEKQRTRSSLSLSRIRASSH
jgi:hypothetical protein